MSRVNGHGPRSERGIPDDILNPFTFSVMVLCGQLSALMQAPDWSTRGQVAEEMGEHLNCLARDLGAVMWWLALNSPDAPRAPGRGSAAAGSGDGT